MGWMQFRHIKKVMRFFVRQHLPAKSRTVRFYSISLILCESNTVNDMKLMILEKIRVIHTSCSSSPRAASVLYNVGGTLYKKFVSL